MIQVPLSLFFRFAVIAALLIASTPSVFSSDEETIAPSADHWAAVLEGTIGKDLEVRMFLFAEPGTREGEIDSVSGWYEYTSMKRPIYLWGENDGLSVTLEENTSDDVGEASSVTGQFEGTLEPAAGDDPMSFFGTWSSPDGATELPFILREVYAPGVAAMDRFYFSSELKITRGSESSTTERTIFLPQIRGDSAAVVRVNAFLRSAALGGGLFQTASEEEIQTWSDLEVSPSLVDIVEAVEQVGSNFDAEELPSLAVESYIDKIEILYNSENLLCVKFYHSEYTGGFHAQYWDSHATFDLTTGNRVSLEDVFRKNATEPLTRLVEEAIRRDYGLRPDQPLSDGPVSIEGFGLNENWFLSPEGLGFSYVPYEIAAYAHGFIRPIVPRDELNTLIAEDSPLMKAVSR